MTTKGASKASPKAIKTRAIVVRDNAAEVEEEIKANPEKKVEKKESHPRINRAFCTMLSLMAFCTILFGSCSSPDDGYGYILLDSDCNSIPVFKFSLPVVDSTALCSTFIAVRYDSRLHSNSVSFAVKVISPSGEIFTENITLPLTENSQVEIRKSKFGIVDIQWPYREHIRASEGEWSITLTPLHKDATQWLHGVGFSYHFDE